MWNTIASAVGGLAGSALGLWDNARSRDWANTQADRNVERSKALATWQAKELPSLQIEGMRAAGINPLLAYSSLGSGSMPSVSTTTPAHEPVGSRLGQALSELPERHSALKTAQAQRELLRAQADESRTRADTAKLQALMAYEQLHPNISLREAQAAYFKGQTLRAGGENKLHFGIPLGIFSWDISHPLGGIFSSRSVQSARDHIQDFRDTRPVSPIDTGLDQYWMPVPSYNRPRSSAPGPRRPPKRPGSLGH